MKWTRYIGWTDNTKRKQTKTNEKALEDGLAGTLRYSRPDWSNSHLIALVVPPAAFRNVCCCFLSLSLQYKFINFTYQTTTVKSSIKNFLELFDGLYNKESKRSTKQRKQSSLRVPWRKPHECVGHHETLLAVLCCRWNFTIITCLPKILQCKVWHK